jgi:tight adherence protein B
VQEPWIVYVIVFVAAVMAFESLYWMIFRGRGARKIINRRLALSQGATSQSHVLETLRQERGFADFESPVLTRFNDYFVQTGLRTSRQLLGAWVAVLAALIWFGVSLFLHSRLLAAIPAVIFAPLLVLFYLRIVRAKRIARFGAQLPDAIDIVVRGLRVGLPFSAAIDLVAREMPDPVGSEFGMTADELTFGQDLATSVNNLHRRVGHEDLLFMVIAVTVQTQTGGNLAEVLHRLSRLLRERAKLRLKVKALSAEGRMSAWFLTAAPFVLFGAIMLLSPKYFLEVQNSPALAPAVIYGALSLVIANYAIFRMVNFKV